MRWRIEGGTELTMSSEWSHLPSPELPCTGHHLGNGRLEDQKKLGNRQWKRRCRQTVSPRACWQRRQRQQWQALVMALCTQGQEEDWLCESVQGEMTTNVAQCLVIAVVVQVQYDFELVQFILIQCNTSCTGTSCLELVQTSLFFSNRFIFLISVSDQ